MTEVSAPDPETLVVKTSTPNTLVLQAYVPILPKHIWSKYTLAQIGDPEAAGFFKNEPPVVGTGPYQAVEWVPGDHIRFTRNPNYWGTQKGAEDEIILQHFASGDTMVQALKTGEIDYVRGVLADQFDALKNEPNIADRRGRRQRLLGAVVQHRRQQEGLRRLDVGADRPRVPRRARLRGRPAEARRLDARRLRHARHDDHPAVPVALARRARQAPQVRHRGGEAPPRRRGLQARRERQAARQGQQGHQPPADLAGLRGRARDGRPVHRRVVRPARASR